MREKRTNMQKFRSGSRSVRFFAREIFGAMETPCWCPSEGHKHGFPANLDPLDLDPLVRIR